MEKNNPTTEPITRGGLTLAQFELRLDHIEMEFMRAIKSAKTLNAVTATAREVAMQRNMNMMVEDLIVQLEMETNVTVDASREESAGSVPCPPRIHRTTTIRNFECGR